MKEQQEVKMSQNFGNASIISTDLILKICLEAGADDAGFVEINREALSMERENILRVYPKTKSIISIIRSLNRENVQSPARYLAAEEFKNTRIPEISRVIVRRLNELGIKGVVITAGFPMDMDRYPGKIWDVSHKLVAVEAGLGHMGHNRNLIHPKFGNTVILNSILISAELDRYDQPLAENPCIQCKLCVASCPTGAIDNDGNFNFEACVVHNYRDLLRGFHDWVDSMVSSKDMTEYLTKYSDSETMSMWQSLAYKPNIKCTYCMAVCPAGEDVLDDYTFNKKQYIQEVLNPLKNRNELVYVLPESRAETIVKRNLNKEIRYVGNFARTFTEDETKEVETETKTQDQISCQDAVASMVHAFQPEIAGDLTADIQFRVSGSEPGTYYLHIEKGQCTFHEGEADNPALVILTPDEVWIAIVRGEIDGPVAFMQGKFKYEGDMGLLLKLPKMFQGNAE
jgi:epoxyqueuosine reductase QueG/putative sterol carrier protein